MLGNFVCKNSHSPISLIKIQVFLLSRVLDNWGPFPPLIMLFMIFLRGCLWRDACSRVSKKLFFFQREERLICYNRKNGTSSCSITSTMQSFECVWEYYLGSLKLQVLPLSKFFLKLLKYIPRLQNYGVTVQKVLIAFLSFSFSFFFPVFFLNFNGCTYSWTEKQWRLGSLTEESILGRVTKAR